MKIFAQAAASKRTALRGLSFDRSDEAQEDYDAAVAAEAEAKKTLTEYAATYLPKAKLNFDIETEEPAAAAPAAPAGGPKSTPGKTETLPTGEIVTTTKTGAKAQIGNAPSPGGPVAKQGPASGADALAAQPAFKTSAQPTGTAPPQAPRDPAARKPNTDYTTPKGVLTWTGTGWVKPRAAAARAK
jgi:hypothetical protein